MKFVTEIDAINPATGEMCKWQGPHIEAISESHARIICDTTGLGYCKVVGRLVAEIDCGDGTIDTNFERIADYSNDN